MEIEAPPDGLLMIEEELKSFCLVNWDKDSYKREVKSLKFLCFVKRFCREQFCLVPRVRRVLETSF